MDKTHICIYHAHCADGFGAAYAVWSKLGDEGVSYIAATYGDEPPDVTDAIVVMVDFSYKRDVLIKMAESAESILVIDHHDTAEKELVDLPDNVRVIFDQTHSGAVLAWHYFHTEPVPHALKLIEDRDLWRFEHAETRAFSARLFAIDFTFEVWGTFVGNDKATERLVREGFVLEAKQQRDVKNLTDVKHIVWLENFPLPDGATTDVPAINCPWMFASDVGHALNTLCSNTDFSATFMFGRDCVKFSLRSQGKAHCGEIAAQFGGGGHPNAAGFSIPHSEFRKLIK